MNIIIHLLDDDDLVRLEGEHIYSIPMFRRPSSTISNMNIYATSGPITMKFYQTEAVLRLGKGCIRFWARLD